MGEKAWAAAALVVVSVFAGCSGGAGGQESSETPVPTIEVTETTGGIRGVVVDAGIHPIPGATVKVLGLDLTQITDKDGNFAFSKVPPGTYFVEASHPLYSKFQQSTDVVAGVADPVPLRIQLIRLISQDPYMITLPYDGYISCSAGQEDAGYSEECGEGVGVPCIVGPPVPCGRVGGRDDNHVQYDFYIDSLNVSSIVMEMYWTPSVNAIGTGELLSVVSTEWVCDPFCGGHTFTCGAGASPMYARADVVNQTASGPEGLQCGFISPGSAEMMLNQPITVFTWANPSHCEPVPAPPPVGPCQHTPTLILDQPYQLFVTLSYFLPLPPCWSFVNDDPDPFRPDAPVTSPDLCND